MTGVLAGTAFAALLISAWLVRAAWRAVEAFLDDGDDPYGSDGEEENETEEEK